MTLYTKHRPNRLEQFYGNEGLRFSLENVLARKKEIPRAFLFTGMSGAGKTTLGRIVANHLKIDPINQHIFNAANTRGIDTVREIIDSSKYKPIYGETNRKVYILEECHMLTTQGQESLLQFLEEPPDGVFIVLTTTEPDKLKITIKRRCFQGEVRPLFRNEMLRLFKDILKKEKEKDLDKEIFDKIYQESSGSPGQALKFLDMILKLDKEKALELISGSTLSEKSLRDLCQALLDEKQGNQTKWKKCQEILKSIEGEPETIRRGVLGYMNKVMLSSPKPVVAANIAANFTENYYDTGKTGLTLSVYLCCFDV